jgi:hypothetical protein
MSLSETIAQNFIGNWQGQVQGSGGALQAEMSISSAGNNQIVGQLHVHSGANLESYELKCTVNTITLLVRFHTKMEPYLVSK